MEVVQSVSNCISRVISDKSSLSVQTFLFNPSRIKVRLGSRIVGGPIHSLILVFVCLVAFFTRSYLT